MVGLVTCLGHFAGTVDIPTHLRRILLADVNARFRIGLALRRILGESSTLEVLRFVIVERVGVEVAVLGQITDALRHLHHLVHSHVAKSAVHHRFGNVLEVFVLLCHRNVLVDGVEHVFGGVLAGKHSAVGQGDWSVDLHHFLDEHRIHGNQTVDVAGILRTLP